MEYPIYTYGGGDLLVAVFNAIAMIFKSDSTYLTPVGTMAMTLGGVYIGIKAIFKGDIGLLGKSWMIPSMIAFVLLFSPKTTVWIKDEVALSAPVKIDNIPFGISFFTSLSSVVSHHLSKLMEETLMPVSTAGATQTGILYGAKAVAKLRDVQIQDPIMLQNVKEYLRQCSMKPYGLGNFGGHKYALLNAKDILAFLDTNPAKCFGIKPINPDGSIGKFMTCTEAGKMVKKAVEAHSKDPLLLSKFGAVLGLSTSNQGLMTKRIKSMTSDTLGYLDQSQLDVNEWMKQSMILNANRESYDDWRQKVGHPRVFPELVKMQATRGMFHQALGSIVGAEMAEAMIPAAAQPVMLALVVLSFVIILPFALLPGGWTYIVTGAKLMIWVCSWPLFYTIIHAIAMIQIKDAVGGWGEEGLSLLGQGGFTELILMKYAAAQSQISAVPIISFAIVFGSPYALSSIAGAVASVASATSIGASMADANLSMAQRSYNTLSRNQENYTPNLTMGGGIIDDGEMRVQFDGRGNTVLTEHQDNLTQNYKATDNVTSSQSASLTNAQSYLGSVTDRKSSQTSITDSENVDVARNIAHGTTHAAGVSLSDTQALRHGFSVGKSTSEGDSTSDSSSTGTSAHLDAKIPGVISGVTGIGGGTSTSASNSKDVRHDMTAKEQQDFQTALDKVKTAARTNGLTSTNSDDIRLNKSFASNLSKLDQIGHEESKARQDVDTFSRQLSYAQTHAGTIDRNANDLVMKEVMHKHPELRSKEQAVRWMNTHRAEADSIARPIIDGYDPFAGSSNHIDSATAGKRAADLTRNTQNVGNMEIPSQESLQDQHAKNTAKVQQHAVVKDATGIEKPLEQVVNDEIKNSNLGYNKDVNEVLNDNLTPEEKITKAEVEKGREKQTETQDKVKEKIANTSKSTIYRAGEEAGTNIGLSDRAIQDKKIIMPGFKK